MSLVKRDGVMLPGKGKLILTKTLTDQIDWLHENAPKNKEWCGVLFYRHIEGDISEPKSLILQAEHLYLMDLGSEAYTDADIDVDSIIEMDDVIPDVRQLKKGLIHTHHNMRAFFSGTDLDELHTNAPFHNYYLSLIVNYAGEYVARVAFTAKKKTQLWYKNVQDEQKEVIQDQEILAMIELDLEFEVPEVAVPDYFQGRFDKLKQEKAEKVQKYIPTFARGNTQIGGGPSQVPKANSGDWSRPHYNWDDDSTRTPGKQAELPFIKENGNLQKGDKELRPYAVVEKEIREKISDWLANGISTFTNGSCKDCSAISSSLEYLEQYFDQPMNEDDYPFFLNQMQRSLTEFFGNYFPKLVSDIGSKVLGGYEDNEVAIDLTTMFDALEHYLDIMTDLEAAAATPVIAETPKAPVEIKKKRK